MTIPNTALPNFTNKFLKASHILSISQTEVIWQKLGLTGKPETNLRKIIRCNLPKIYPYLSLAFPNRDEMYSIYKNMFDELGDQMGEDYLIAIHNWMSHFYHEYGYREEQNNQLTNGLIDTFLYRWALSLKQEMVNPTLSVSLLSQLREIVIYHNQLDLNIREVWANLIDLPRDEWEQKVWIGAGLESQVKNQMRFVIRVSLWRKILSLLNEQEVEMLRQWSNENRMILISSMKEPISYNIRNELKIVHFDIPISTDF